MILSRLSLFVILATLLLFSCADDNEIKNYRLRSNCLDLYKNCDSIYHFDSTYNDLANNLLFARWQIRKGNNKAAIKILDSLEVLQKDEKKNKFYQDIILFNYQAKQHTHVLDLKNIDDQLKQNLGSVHNINMLYFKSKFLRLNQEINYSFVTALYAEYLRSKLSLSKKDEVYYLPWSIHSINLIREHCDTTICKHYLQKTLAHCKTQSPGCRWMKTLSLTLNENLNELEINNLKKEVLSSDQYSPETDKKINTHLNWVASDDQLAIKNLLSEIDDNKPLSDPINFYNTTYLIDAYIAIENLKEAEKWLDALFDSNSTSITLNNLALYRKLNLFHSQYKKVKSKKKLLELYECSKQLMLSYFTQGRSIINEHYADAIYKSNNIFLETLFALKSHNEISNNEILIHLNDIKNLYNKVSDSRSVLGNKLPSGSDLQKINQLKHEIEMRELIVNRYQDTTYQEMSIFEELYFLHQELYELKQSLPEVKNITTDDNDSVIRLSSIDNQTQIIDFIQTDSSVFLSRISSENIVLKKLNYNQVINSIQEKKTKILNSKALVETNYLDSVLIDLISIKHPKIVFIPDGDLFDFPIETIKDYSDNYLNDKYLISYASQISEAICQDLLKLKDNLFAASYTNSSTVNDRREKSYPELFFAEFEVEQISNTFSNTEIFSGYEFTEESLSNALDKDVVHISSHSSSSTDNPLNNYILVRDDKGSGIPIYGFTLKSMEWQSKLVILSSCESGTGTIKPGAGIFSLSRDFIQTGAETVIKSLWKVNDKSTSELMILFHKNLKNGDTAIQALRQAKIDLRSQEHYSHPYYWAGFILEGNPNVSFVTQ